jgi:hypothetical protein
MPGKLLISFGLTLISHAVLTQTSSDHITTPASSKYKTKSFFKKLFAGTNYRQEWETPVTMPVFDLRKSKLRIKEMGGGQQTTSLYLLDENNREWVLRSVDKDYKPPKKIIQNTFIERTIQDHISAAYPYAGLSVTHLSNAAGIIAGRSHLYYVPDDTAFGEYRALMANKVFLLISYLPDSIQELATEDMLKKIADNKNYTIDQKEYLKVRLVDWLISDWDRHPGQYKWIQKTTPAGISIRVVPRDRDQAFFSSNGLLFKFISLFFMPHMSGFKKSRNDIKRLSNKARDLDKRCTDQLTKEDWINITKEFRNKMSDDVITAAIKKQPPEIFAIRGDEIIETLKSRRNRLLENVMKYYSVLN